MTDTEARIATLVATAPRAQVTRVRLALIAAAALLTIMAATGLVLGIANTAANNAAVKCLRVLGANQNAQNDARAKAAEALRTVGTVHAAAEYAQAADIQIIADVTATIDQRRAALANFQQQDAAKATSWQTYVDASLAAEKVRGNNPTSLSC